VWPGAEPKQKVSVKRGIAAVVRRRRCRGVGTVHLSERGGDRATSGGGADGGLASIAASLLPGSRGCLLSSVLPDTRACQRRVLDTRSAALNVDTIAIP